MRAGLAVVVCGWLGLVGCGGGSPVVSTVQQPIAPLSDVALTGVVSSGTQPIVGAHVYLFAAGTSGYGQASVSVVSAAETGTSDSVGAYVLTNANGGFSLTGDYACSSGQQLYLYALGGNAGSGVNSAIGLMAAIGSCPSASGPAVVATVNEVSTVAAAYAMAGFATDAMHVSSSGTALAQVGVANAFANAGNLVTLATGVALATTPAGNGAVPQAEINTLANVLASCVNASASCDTLFATATADGTTTGTKATDTASAAINIVHSPGANVAALYGLATGITTFGPALTAQPNDFTIAINFAGVGPYGIVGITIDGSGDVWIEYSPGNALIKFSSSGAAISGPNGYPAGGLNNSDYGVAIDRSGNVWAANVNSGTISEFTSSGTQISGSGGYIGGGLVSPYSLAIDGLGNLWAVNRTNLSELNSLGAAISGTSGYTGGGLNVDPGVIAIDGSGNVWVTNYYNSLAKFGPSGAAISGSSGYTGGGLSDPLGIAIDGSGNVWIANASGGGIIKFNSSGISVSGPSGYTGGGLNVPYGIAVDGSGDIWVTNASGNSISAFNSSGIAISGSSGYTRSGLNGPRGIALDGSGNVWVTSGGGVVEFIGVATPVITPICAGLPATPTTDGTSKLGTRP